MKRIVVSTAAVLCAILTLGLIQELLKPKYISSIHEGNLIEEYYDEVKAHDVIFIGDCEVFSNISPVKLWEDYGITSYIRGSAQQLIWQSYYLLKETLTYEIPKVVVLNALAMKYNDPQKEAYNRLTLDGMKLSMNKIAAIKASMLEEESMLTYLIPLLRYHSRWSELSGEDFQYLFHKNTLSHNGFLMRVDIKPVTVIPKGKKLPDYRFGDRTYAYLDRITKLCKDNNIELVLIKSPSVYPYWYEEWDNQIVDYARKKDITYINFLKATDAIGIDYYKDTFDGGLHLNLSGAEKFSDYLGKLLVKEYGLADHRQEEKYVKIWSDKVEFYTSMKAEQDKELIRYGYLKSYGATAQVANSKE